VLNDWSQAIHLTLLFCTSLTFLDFKGIFNLFFSNYQYIYYKWIFDTPWVFFLDFSSLCLTILYSTYLEKKDIFFKWLFFLRFGRKSLFRGALFLHYDQELLVPNATIPFIFCLFNMVQGELTWKCESAFVRVYTLIA
jgi:hypothetical protein